MRVEGVERMLIRFTGGPLDGTPDRWVTDEHNVWRWPLPEYLECIVLAAPLRGVEQLHIRPVPDLSLRAEGTLLYRKANESQLPDDSEAVEGTLVARGAEYRYVDGESG